MPTHDITRSIFDARKQYTSVRMQQGRVLVDDDWNESESIDNEDQRRTRIDVIGPAGTPDTGFKIEPMALPIAANTPINFRILPGTFYLGGHRLELEQEATLRDQNDWLRVSASLPTRPTAQRDDLVYLEVYEQPVSAAEDSELMEAALGGPDTSTRTRVVQRIGVFPNVNTADCAVAWQAATGTWAASGEGTIDADMELVSDARLGVTFVPGAPPADLCAPTLAGGYLGAENQAIRVELLGSNTLIWGFDNAAPVYRVTLSNAGARVTMVTLPRDDLHWPLVDQVVEIIPVGELLPNGERLAELRGHLAKVTRSYDPASHTFEIATAAPNVATNSVQPPVPALQTWAFGEEWKSRADRTTLEAAGSYAYLRVWNRGAPVTGAIPVSYTAGSPATLGNTGIAVTINGTSRRAGDYWIIGARPETPLRIVPWQFQTPTGRAANGVRRWRAPLGIIRWTPAAGNTLTSAVMHDCRIPFRPLTRLRGCCLYRVGDELHSYGDFSTIQAAIDALPPEGGEICLLPGEWEERIRIVNKVNVEIHGCGGESRVIQPATGTGPIVAVFDSQDVVLRGFSITATTDEAVRVEQTSSAKSPVENVRLENLDIDARDRTGVMIRGGRKYQLLRNRVTVHQLAAAMNNTSDAGRWAAVTVGADDVLIELNRVVVGNTDTMPMTPFGGIQLLGLSDHVEIRRNYIERGTGNGITLGSVVMVPPGTTDPTGGNAAPGLTTLVDGSGCVHVGIFDPGGGGDPVPVPISEGRLTDIRIVDNDIVAMGANGIGVIQFFDLSDDDNAQFITVDRLSIEDNRIRGCMQLEPLEPPPELVGDVGYGGIALADGEHIVIRQNRIERNGRNHIDPVCGIFILRAEGLVIEHNHVLDNGPVVANTGDTFAAGYRGGIVILRVVPGTGLSSWDGRDVIPDASELPALRVHDNIVDHPIGRALFVVGLGQMSVEGNQLASHGSNVPSILNLVFEIFQLMLDVKANGANAGTSAQLSQLMFELISGRTVTIINTGISPELFALLVYAEQKKAGSGFGGNGLATGVMGVAALGKTLANQLRPLVRAGGNVLFTDNQVRFDLPFRQQVLALSSVTIISIDEITAHDNQLDCVMESKGLMLSDLLALGWSVSVQGNRMKEYPARALLSALTYAIFNNTSGNQGTHCFLVKGTAALKVSHSNRSFVGSLVPEFCSWLGDDAITGPTP